MFRCPNDGFTLTRRTLEGGVGFHCDRCEGELVGVGPLRRSLRRDIIGSLWARARREGAPGRPCGSCQKPMQTVAHPLDDGEVQLDVCPSCQVVWFDAGERAQLPAMKTQPEVKARERSLPPEAVRMLAVSRAEQTRRESERRLSREAEASGYRATLGMFFPVLVSDEGDIEPTRAWVTWLLAVMCIFVGFIFTATIGLVAPDWGLVPADAMRHGGTTFVTSFFLHVGVRHVIGNVYFLVVFGTAVEGLLGAKRMAILVIASALLGDLLHIMADPTSTIPVIGASGGVSGVMIFFLICFPKAKMGQRVTWFRRQLFYFPAWVFIGAWTVIQLLGVYLQFKGHTTGVSFAGHFGGIVAGLICFAVWREVRPKARAPLRTLLD